ncbi:MAG TPA: FAD synthetase family protein [Methylomirabilota bacterium]|nr:FAD synthetase family protein [Methylomirabilota bacterium]
MDVVTGVEGLRPEHGPIFAVVGVFDGLHRGHAYLLEHLVREAQARSAHPAVITFDAHPDEVLTGSAPPLLIHPDERLERLAAAGVEVTVVQHFDDAVRRTPYDAFVATIRGGCTLAGLLMTPDAAFGFERRGTPDTLAELGRARGFDVVVVPPFTLEGRAVRSSDIRAAIAAGDLRTAAELLGRPVSLRGELRDGALSFDWPLALPPDGEYATLVAGSDARLRLSRGEARLEGRSMPTGPVELSLGA